MTQLTADELANTVRLLKRCNDECEAENKKLREWIKRSRETLEATVEYICHECEADCGCIGCCAAVLLKEPAAGPGGEK